MVHDAIWPSLPLDAWKDTYATLHMWAQVVGKVRLMRSPLVNHWWAVPFYVTSRGLTTSPIAAPPRTFEIDFDFIDHRLLVRASDGSARALALEPRSVAEFYRMLMHALDELGLATRIHTRPVEVEEAIRFEEDERHASYDAEYANRFWRVLVQSDRVLREFRALFLGKCSPVHFFWGAFDLAVSRFSGRRAPEHPGGFPNVADWVVREAYSHEVSSCGFWPGGGPMPDAAFYAYVYPEPAGYPDARVDPSDAYYHRALREFVLPYETVRTAGDPDRTLFEFLQSTYEAAADLGRWDRASLERAPPELRQLVARVRGDRAPSSPGLPIAQEGVQPGA